jgi:hypothetical protein
MDVDLLYLKLAVKFTMQSAKDYFQMQMNSLNFTDGGMLEQTATRMNIYGDSANEGIRRETVQELAAILERVNPYVHLFRHGREKLNEGNVKLLLFDRHRELSQHARVHNLPIC